MIHDDEQTLTSRYNIAPRLTALTSSLSDPNHPGTLISGIHYNAAGALLQASLGNGLSETRGYDARLRLNSITDGAVYSLSIPANGYAPNSDILIANDSVNGNWTYTYDNFNRLKTATGQSYSYDYDRFGNRWHQNGPHSSQLSFDANNRIAAGNGVTYDAAGNVTNDGSHTYTYDDENRLTAVDGGATASYVYDAGGQRIRKTTTSSVDYLYDLSGHVISEVNSSGGWNRGEVYAGGKHLATYNNGTTYFDHTNWLGTERARTGVNGLAVETCTSLPFGDWQSCSGSDVSPNHFTGKERDSESGLDNFGARYDASSLGRFMTPDPLMASGHARNPQTWNRYAYALNNPLRFVDPDGMDVPADCAKDKKCTIVVKINVIYDKTVNDGKGLTDAQKKQFEKDQVAKAQKDYGNSNVKLDVTYTQGSFTMDNGRAYVSGLRSDALNVVASNGTPTGATGDSGVDKKTDVAISFINVNDAHSANAFPLFTNTTEHELMHQFVGDVYKDWNPLSYEANEFVTDGRVAAQAAGANQQSVREGLEPRRYAAPLNPEANKPQQ